MERCSRCGKLCKPVDFGIYFGDSVDKEPPDTQWFCKNCAQFYLENPTLVVAGMWRVKPDFVTRVVSERTHSHT